MFPTTEQIEVAAYHLWERRARLHGCDRQDWEAAEKELIYNLNYGPVREYGLLVPVPQVLGNQAVRHCRLCERDSKRARFGPPSPVFPTVPNLSLLTAQICAECQHECRDPLAEDLARFWDSLRSADALGDTGVKRRTNRGFSLGAYKSLVASALLIMPDREISYFLDTIEWVGNSDRDADHHLFAGASCRVYLTADRPHIPAASLARRIDEDALLPYMIMFLSYEGIIVQIHLPLCSKDEDLEGGQVPLPERLFGWGYGRSVEYAHSTLMPLAAPGDVGRSQGRRSFAECT